MFALLTRQSARPTFTGVRSLTLSRPCQKTVAQSASELADAASKQAAAATQSARKAFADVVDSVETNAPKVKAQAEQALDSGSATAHNLSKDASASAQSALKDAQKVGSDAKLEAEKQLNNAKKEAEKI